MVYPYFDKMRKEVVFIFLAFSLILISSTLVSAVLSSCSQLNCVLYPGLAGVNQYENQIEVQYVGVGKIRLVVEENVTSLLGEGDLYENRGIKIKVIKIDTSSSPNHIELEVLPVNSACEKDFCVLYPGLAGVNQYENQIEVQYVGVGKIRLVVEENVTSLLGEGDLYENRGIKIKVIKIDTSSSPNHIELETTLKEECVEDWVCITWSACLNNQKTRTCTDFNSCGTTKNKPLETQSCSVPTPDIECFSEEDCWIDIAGQPYCEGDELCIPSIIKRCRNAGTEQSYCESSEGVDCAPSDECKDSPPPQRECEQIGLRQSRKYCSPQYVLVNQKAEETSCENSFECKSNVCLNGKCGEDKPSKLVYWILGIIIVSFIFGLILYLLIKTP